MSYDPHASIKRHPFNFEKILRHAKKQVQEGAGQKVIATFIETAEDGKVMLSGVLEDHSCVRLLEMADSHHNDGWRIGALGEPRPGSNALPHAPVRPEPPRRKGLRARPLEIR